MRIFNIIIWVINRDPICVSGIKAKDCNTAVELALDMFGVRFDETYGVDVFDMPICNNS